MQGTRAGRLAWWAGLALAGCTGVALALSRSALPVVVDVRPGLLVVAGAAAALLAVGWRRSRSPWRRAVAAGACVLAGATFLATAWDLTLRYRTEEVSFENEGVTLRGTLYIPGGEGPHPALILVHGSGRQARDEYAFYAREYARRGIAALAYDKRGSGASGGSVTTATYEQLAADAASGIALLRGRPEIDGDRVGIWGLSEGEWVGTLAAIKTDPAVLLLISPSAMTPSRQVQYQTGANVLQAGFTPDEARRAQELYGRLTSFQRTGEGRDELNRELRLTAREPWFGAARYLEASVPEYERVQALEWFPTWRARMDFDALPLFARIRCPVLAQAGGRDPKNDGREALARIEAALAQAGNTAFTGLLYPNAGHGLIEWRLPLGLPPPWFAPGYIEAQLDWADEQLRPGT
jgi:uncharacterized protein